MANTQGSMNQGSGLPALDNADLQVILGTRISEYMVEQTRRENPVNLFLTVDADVDLCGTITYLCEDNSDLPTLEDSATDSAIVARTMEPPRTVTFTGFCKGSLKTKISREQLACLNQSDVLRNWHATSLARAMSDGQQTIFARFYRHLRTNGVHPANTGNNAGLITGGHILGEPGESVILNPASVDDWLMELLGTVRQMPRAVQNGNEFGVSAEDMFFVGPPEIESLLMKNPEYNSWSTVGDCANCGLFTDTFNRMPRGIMPITSFCIEPHIISSGGNDCKVYPILFGRRYQGSKAAVRLQAQTYTSIDGASTFFQTDFYWHIHTFDSRYLGLSWVSIQDTKPKTLTCG